MKNSIMNRRRFLQGTGVTIGLPFLEAMIPSKAMAQAAATPLRSVVMMMPNGVCQEDSDGGTTWQTGGSGTSFTMPSGLSALNGFRSRLIFPRGLNQAFADWRQGVGDHSKSAATFLTNARPGNADGGTGLRYAGGVSADQKMADFVKAQHKSVERRMLYLGHPDACCPDHFPSTIYSSNISWRGNTTPETKEDRPINVFKNLFTNQTGGGAQTDALSEYRRLTRRSVLDAVIGQISSLKAELGASDNEKMDQYFTALREVESKLVTAPGPTAPVGNSCPQVTAPADNLRFDVHTRMMMDLAVLAMACDKTRVITYLLRSEGGGSFNSFLNVSSEHHTASHYKGEKNESPINQTQLRDYRTITNWYSEQFAYFLRKMTEFKEGNGDLLSNSMVAFGPGMRTGNAHDDHDIPIIVAGEAGGRWKPGRVVGSAGQSVPIANLWLTMMRTMGMTNTSHGDSNGTFNFG